MRAHNNRYMCYLHRFGLVEQSWAMAVAFGVTSLVAAVVESLPISTRLDDNLTVPLASALVGSLVLYSMGVRSLCCMSSERSSVSSIVEMVFAGSSE
jgi:farnesol kinase